MTSTARITHRDGRPSLTLDEDRDSLHVQFARGSSRTVDISLLIRIIEDSAGWRDLIALLDRYREITVRRVTLAAILDDLRTSLMDEHEMSTEEYVQRLARLEEWEEFLGVRP